MTKLIPRLFVALMAFAFSVSLTSLSKLVRNTDSPPITIALEQDHPEFGLAQDEKQLREIYREYGPAQTRHDRAFFERVETENFILFAGQKNLSREDDIRQMLTWRKDIVYTSTVEDLKIFGNIAVIRGQMQARYNNGWINSWDFVDICIKRGGVWRIQSTTQTN